MQLHCLLNMSNLYIQHTVSIANNTVKIDGVDFFCGEKEDAFNVFAKAFYKDLKLDYAKFYKMDALSKLGFLGGEILLDKIDRKGIEPKEIALIFANKSASLHTDSIYQETVNDIPSPAIFVYTLPNIVLGELSIKHDLKGESMFFVQDEFDADFMSQYVTTIFKNTTTKYCITAWVEMGKDETYNAKFYLISKNKGNIDFNTKNLI